METWHKFWRKSGYERGIALEAAATLTATWAGLRIAGYRRWRNLLAQFLPATNRQTLSANLSDSKIHQQSTLTIARMEAAAARHLPFSTNCLEQSLALWWLLKRRGIPADLRIGVRKNAGSFEAHAWVEANGTVLNEPGDQHTHFVPLESAIPSLETQQN
jgi:Transglutaminase-like superfamily